MNHLPYVSTPVVFSHFLSQAMDVSIFIKREDLFMKAGGGSKARMLQYILKSALENNAQYILTAGGPYSNFNRALALMCKQLGLKMRLVIYDNNKHIDKISLNKRICDYCGVEYIECAPDKVVSTIEAQQILLKEEGKKYYYIWGGGKSNEGVYSYMDCVKEIRDQLTVCPDYIVTALGTGTTFAGLTLGCKLYLPKTVVLGISVARKQDTAFQVVEEIMDAFQNVYYKEPIMKPVSIKKNIIDDFLLGGYGSINNDCSQFIKKAIYAEATIFDEIYVGKALYGLKELLSNDKSFRRKNILFMNTGGIYNF